MPVKVIHLITLLEMGGAQGNTIYTVEHLLSDFNVQLWSGRGAYWDDAVKKNPALRSRLRFFSALVRPLNPLLDCWAVFQLVWALKKEKPVILHTHSSKAGVVGRLAARIAGVPIVIHTFHGFGFNDQQKPWIRAFFIWLERTMAPLSTWLIFVSQSNLNEARRLEIGRPAQSVLIRSGVPLARIAKVVAQSKRADIRTQLGVPESAILITTIGAFKPQKNLLDFLEMASHVVHQKSNTYFLIIGDGVQRPLLEKRARELGVKNHLLMPGWREDVAPLLAASDVFVMTSLWEGLPRALVEAVYAGIPAVCYQTDGIQDLFQPDEGYSVERKDWKALAAKVLEWLDHPALARAAAARQRAKITPDFDIDLMVDQQKALYRRCLPPEK